MSLNRLLTILFVCVIVFSACDRDMGITEHLLLKEDPNAEIEAGEPSLIPDWLKEKIWGNEETLLEELIALEEDSWADYFINGIRVDGTDQVAMDLANQIVSIQEKERIHNKWVNAGGIAILGTRWVTTTELEIARDIVLTMSSKHPDLREYLSFNTGFYILLYNQFKEDITYLPEYSQINFGKKPVFALGICGNVCITPSGGINLAGEKIKPQIRFRDNTCSELDQTKWRYDTDTICRNFAYEKYLDWTTLVHEFAHAMHRAIASKDSTFDSKLLKAYQNAVAKELWTVKAERYSSVNFMEYWAVNSEKWFMPVASTTVYKNGVLIEIPAINQNSLEELDPQLYALMNKWYPKTEILEEQDPWRFVW